MASSSSSSELKTLTVQTADALGKVVKALAKDKVADSAEAEIAQSEAVEDAYEDVSVPQHTDRLSRTKADAILDTMLGYMKPKIPAAETAVVKKALLKQFGFLGGADLAFPPSGVIAVAIKTPSGVVGYSIGREAVIKAIQPHTRNQVLRAYSDLYNGWLNDVQFRQRSKVFSILTPDDVSNQSLKEEIKAYKAEKLDEDNNQATRTIAKDAIRSGNSVSVRTQG